MRDYLHELGNLTQIGEQPPFCWVTDFAKIEEQNEGVAAAIGNLSFEQKLDVALSIPSIKEVYGSDIVRDENGNVTASRCWFFVKNLTMARVEQQTKMLESQRNVSRTHPANANRSEFAFFTFSVWYIIWVCVWFLLVTPLFKLGCHPDFLKSFDDSVFLHRRFTRSLLMS